MGCCKVVQHVSCCLQVLKNKNSLPWNENVVKYNHTRCPVSILVSCLEFSSFPLFCLYTSVLDDIFYPFIFRHGCKDNSKFLLTLLEGLSGKYKVDVSCKGPTLRYLCSSHNNSILPFLNYMEILVLLLHRSLCPVPLHVSQRCCTGVIIFLYLFQKFEEPLVVVCPLSFIESFCCREKRIDGITPGASVIACCKPHAELSLILIP